MAYSFSEKTLKQGNRYFIKIPFNVWKECGQKGLVPVSASIQGCNFECKLVPKGEGVYYIPITKGVINQIDSSDEINISFEIIDGLSRINHNSPYTVHNPIRKIDSIQNVTYPKDGYCGQMCIAMLTGLSVDKIVDIMQTKSWQCSFSKIIETLDYFGILHDEKVTYTRGKKATLPECCIVSVKSKQRSHFTLYYKGKYYDTIDFNTNVIIGYLRVIIE